MSFDQSVFAILTAKGLTLDAAGQWVRDPSHAGAASITDDLLRFLNASGGQGDTNARLKCQWVENFSEVVQQLCRDGDAAPWPFRSVFWIRLHGIIAELRSEVRATFASVALDPESAIATPGSLLDHAQKQFRAIETIRQAFTEDELIYAEYRRHTEGHPTQRSYDLRWSRAGTVADRHAVSTLGKEFSVEELRAAICRVLAEYANEAAIPISFARRIQGAVRPLVEIVRRGAR